MESLISAEPGLKNAALRQLADMIYDKHLIFLSLFELNNEKEKKGLISELLVQFKIISSFKYLLQIL